MSLPPGLAERVIAWQTTHGRQHLPWQGTRDPYRVWLSEIMLQQTQVATVLDYYPRFLARFPDVGALAQADLDEVLGLWSGLGYYSRARHLHRCAQTVVRDHGGTFPRQAQQLQTLPGVGRSTAAAIAAFCHGERVAILDGNVKRVLTRVLGYREDLAQARHEKALWTLAQALLPAGNGGDLMPRYTQGLMDLGATVCTHRQPVCRACPLHCLCVAAAQGHPGNYPVRTRKLHRSVQTLWLLQAQDTAQGVWLCKRPSRGIWASLYALPAFDSYEALTTALPGNLATRCQIEPDFVHVLTHKDLHLHPVSLRLQPGAALPLEGAWFRAHEWAALGLPAPVRKLLDA